MGPDMAPGSSMNSDVAMASDGNTGHSDQPLCSPAAVGPLDIHMVLGGSPDHRHMHDIDGSVSPLRSKQTLAVEDQRPQTWPMVVAWPGTSRWLWVVAQGPQIRVLLSAVASSVPPLHSAPPASLSPPSLHFVLHLSYLSITHLLIVVVPTSGLGAGIWVSFFLLLSCRALIKSILNGYQYMSMFFM